MMSSRSCQGLLSEGKVDFFTTATPDGTNNLRSLLTVVDHSKILDLQA